MPTVVTKKIGATNTPVTMDYSTLQAWEDALPADLVSGDTQQIGECYDQGTFTAALTISGQTTDATRNIILRTATGASFADKDHASPLLAFESAYVNMDTSSSPALVIGTSNVLVQKLQFASTAGYEIVIQASGSPTNVVVERCVLYGLGASFYTVQPLGTGWTFTNCLIQGELGAMNNQQCEMYFCTVIRQAGATGTFGGSAYTNFKVVNCAIFNWTTFLSVGTLRAGSGYNASDLGAVGGNTGDVTSLTFADQFEDTSNDFRLKSGNSLATAGTPVAGITTDIMGYTRNVSTPSIGCWEAAAAASPVGMGRAMVNRLRPAIYSPGHAR